MLIRLMSYVDDEEYEQNQEFTMAQLGTLTPANLMKWFNNETFGNPEPPENHDLNPVVRCNSIEYWKKALSSYMPNRLMPWNELAGVGNPTRSTQLNALIKYIKKKEARGQQQRK